MTTGSVLPPAVVLGVDTAIGLTVVRELGRHGVPVIGIGQSQDAVGRSSRFTQRFIVRPKDQSLGAWLPRLIAETGAGALLAINERDLLALADLPPVIDGCRILTPRRAPLETVLDKTRTLALARTLGIAVPASWQPMTGEDFAERAPGLAYPAVLKWSDPPAVQPRLKQAGIAFEKTVYADGPEQLLDLLARYKRINRYPLVQSWCAGTGFGQMLMMAGGKAQLCFQHRRIHEWPISGGVSTLCASVPLARHRDQMARSEALLAAIGWEGPAMVEYRYDPASGTYWLMEINGRFWGSLPLASHCGARFAWEQYRFGVLGASQAEDRPLRMRRARYMIPETKRLLQVLARHNSAGNTCELPSRGRALAGYMAEFFNPRTRYYVNSLADPGPFVRDMIGIVNRLRRSRNLINRSTRT